MKAPSTARLPVLGVITGAIAGIADTIVALFRPGPLGTFSDFAEAAFHLIALWAPIGWLVGLALAGAVELWRHTPWTRAARARLVNRQRLFARDPAAFAGTIGLAAGVAVFFLGLRLSAHHFATRYHDPVLAAWAMAVAGLALLASAFAFAALVRHLLWSALRDVRRGPSLGSALLFLAGAGASAIGWAAYVGRRLFALYQPVEWLWPPVLAVVFALLARFTRRWEPRRGIALVLALVGIVITAITYGEHSRVRGIVERRAVTGQMLVRFYGRLTDRDGDGHSFAFGGGDCDDSRAFVHPGAMDAEGDGIDADCFDGDGVTTRVVELTDGDYGEVPDDVPERPNVILLTIDTLRPDHLGCHGYDRPTSPAMDVFCRNSTDFTEVIAQSSRSIRSIPAMLTGLYPSQIAYGPEYLWPTLRESNDTLAEQLGEAGYHTSVVMGTDYFERIDGFFQGFEQVEESPAYRPPRSWPVTRGLRELDRLTASQRPFFLWVHLFNVHEEYLWDGTPSRFGPRAKDEYDTEILLADEEIGRVLDAIEARGLFEESVVVIASDHGEAFGEHNNRGHSRTLYEEEVKAVTMIRAPGFEPRTVDDRIALFDLFPTILNLARIPSPRAIPARSLVPQMRGEPANPERVIFSELMPDGLYPFDQKAIYRGDHKLIWWTREGTNQLFDLSADPGELNDLADEDEKTAEELAYSMRAWLAQMGRPDNRTHDVIAANRLAALPREVDERLDVVYPGLFRVAGYDIESRTVAPGERIQMDLYYEVLGETTRDFFFVLDIQGPSGFVVPPHFHAHHYPINGRYKTFQWRDGEFLRDPVEMVVPRDIRAPVTLQLQLTVLDGGRPIPARRPDGSTLHTIPLGEVSIVRDSGTGVRGPRPSGSEARIPRRSPRRSR